MGQRKKILPIGKEFLFFFLFFIFLHAMAMSEGTDNTGERGLVYGIAPDRNRWVEYANDTDNTIFFYDTRSIVKKNNKVRAWIKFGEPVNDESRPRFFREATALKEIDCEARLIRSVEWHYVSMNGEHRNYPSPTPWENIEPETAEDALLETVCPRPKNVRKRRNK